MFFSTLEYLIPKPVPFFRIGLANLPILVTLHFFSWKHTLVLVLLKVLGQGLVNGTLASYVFLFSLFGSAGSAVVMLAVHRAAGKYVSLAGVSIAGALASNVIQLTLSIFFIFGPQSWIMAPPFLVLGVTAGLFVGLLAERFRRTSRWLAVVEDDYRGFGLGS